MSVRHRILHGLALNRAPGFHFAGNFLGISYDRVAADDARISLDPGTHCEDAAGEVSLGAVAMLADIALASSIRAAIGSDSARLATVSMHLQFTGVPLAGRLEAHGTSEGFTSSAAQQGLARFTMDANAARACFGMGAFMALPPPKGTTMSPVVMARERMVPPLTEDDLDDSERAILARADAALARSDAKHAFISRFWGYEPRHARGAAEATMDTGAHVGNRVGHVQGGILVGFGATCAIAALPSAWRLASATACFVSPGEGKQLHARSALVHRGMDTAVVRTEVTGVHERRVLELLTTHARGATD